MDQLLECYPIASKIFNYLKDSPELMLVSNQFFIQYNLFHRKDKIWVIIGLNHDFLQCNQHTRTRLYRCCSGGIAPFMIEELCSATECDRRPYLVRNLFDHSKLILFDVKIMDVFRLSEYIELKNDGDLPEVLGKEYQILGYSMGDEFNPVCYLPCGGE